MKKCLILVLLVFLFGGCGNKETENSSSALLEFPGLDWNASMEEIEELFPGGETHTYENVPEIAYYDVDGAKLWGDAVSLSFQFWQGYLEVLWCSYEDEEIEPDAIREKVRAAYGDPWKEYTWQEGKNKWRSEERMIDRVPDEAAARKIGEKIQEIQNGRERYDYLNGIYQSLCENYLVRLSFDEEHRYLTWRVGWYTIYHEYYSAPRESGKVPLEQLMEASEGGEEVYGEDGFLQEIRYACDEGRLGEFEKQFGSSSERFLSYDMPEGSIFWVSEEQVYDSFGKESEKKAYLSMISADPSRDENTSFWVYAKMYRTPLVMLYWDEEAKELVWDLTGQANLERVRAELS